jgi:hypothetical protein
MCHTHAQSAHMRVYTLEYKRARECAIAAQALWTDGKYDCCEIVFLCRPTVHWQLSNWMTSQLSAPAKSSLTMVQLSKRQNSLSRSESVVAVSALRAAKGALLRMDVIGLTENMDAFEEALAARWPDMFDKGGDCRIPSGAQARNPTTKHELPGNASSILNVETQRAIRELNLLDEDLYRLAKEIAQAQSTCVLEGKRNDYASSVVFGPRPSSWTDASGSGGALGTRSRTVMRKMHRSTTIRQCFEQVVHQHILYLLIHAWIDVLRGQNLWLRFVCAMRAHRGTVSCHTWATPLDDVLDVLRPEAMQEKTPHSAQ